MSEVICNTSPLQYFYQLGMLHVFQALAGRIIVPPAVVHELAVGRPGVSLPDPTVLEWITVRPPASTAVLPLVMDLGPGETEVLALALESTDAIVILDDALARQMATTLAIRFVAALVYCLMPNRRASYRPLPLSWINCKRWASTSVLRPVSSFSTSQTSPSHN